MICDHKKQDIIFFLSGKILKINMEFLDAKNSAIYTKNHWIIYFNWVNCMVCELHLNEFFLSSIIEIMLKNLRQV